MIRTISAQGAPAAIGPYSHAVFAGPLLFTSGQIALDPASGKLAGESIEEQACQIFKNLHAVLAAADFDFSNVVKTVIYMTDLSDFSKVNQLYGELFSGNPPARSCVQVAALPAGAKLEIEMIAAEK